MSATPVVAGALSSAERGQIAALDAAAAAADGRAPFSEATRLGLDAGLPGVRHVLRRADGPSPDGPAPDGSAPAPGAGPVVGYAQVGPDGATELAVHPEHRRRGHGRALLDAVLNAGLDAGADAVPAGGATPRIWSYSGHPGAAALARAAALGPVRELWRMRRPLPLGPEHDPPGPVPLPPGVRVRTFVPGRDEAAWLALNAAAFAGHGEQGRLTRAELDARMAAPWFDPAGFFLAERPGPDGQDEQSRLVGFHWTKTHPADPAAGVSAAGEIYVLGVDPGEHGGGLGRALSRIGLRHLTAARLGSVLLYVDADNAAAVAVYTRLGFATEAVSVMYAPTQNPMRPANSRL